MSHPGSQGCDIDLSSANFIQWAHEGGNCYSTIKLYCNQLKAALVWASRHGCLLSRTYNDFEVPRYFKSLDTKIGNQMQNLRSCFVNHLITVS